MAHLQKLISSSAASPSTAATPNSNHNYDVFVNGHGQDVKKTLASHLHHLLLLDGFRVCFDQQEILEEGVSLNSQIRGAIATASVHVAIFSPRFAESKWCLEELVLMLESGKTIIPVFYHVKPSDLRIRAGNGEDGVYGRALLDLEKNSRNEPNSHTVWREALSRVADISGLELEACNGDEGELVDRVVQLVEEKVIETQLLAAYPIGLDEKLEAFKNMVLTQQQQQGVQTTIVGIVGSGGVGKTTLAIEFFERNRSDYNGSCFLYDVKGAAENGVQSCYGGREKQEESYEISCSSGRSGICFSGHEGEKDNCAGRCTSCVCGTNINGMWVRRVLERRSCRRRKTKSCG